MNQDSNMKSWQDINALLNKKFKLLDEPNTTIKDIMREKLSRDIYVTHYLFGITKDEIDQIVESYSSTTTTDYQTIIHQIIDQLVAIQKTKKINYIVSNHVVEHPDFKKDDFSQLLSILGDTTDHEYPFFKIFLTRLTFIDTESIYQQDVIKEIISSFSALPDEQIKELFETGSISNNTLDDLFSAKETEAIAKVKKAKAEPDSITADIFIKYLTSTDDTAIDIPDRFKIEIDKLKNHKIDYFGYENLLFVARSAEDPEAKESQITYEQLKAIAENIYSLSNAIHDLEKSLALFTDKTDTATVDQTINKCIANIQIKYEQLDSAINQINNELLKKQIKDNLNLLAIKGNLKSEATKTQLILHIKTKNAARKEALIRYDLASIELATKRAKRADKQGEVLLFRTPRYSFDTAGICEGATVAYANVIEELDYTESTKEQYSSYTDPIIKTEVTEARRPVNSMEMLRRAHSVASWGQQGDGQSKPTVLKTVFSSTSESPAVCIDTGGSTGDIQPVFAFTVDKARAYESGTEYATPKNTEYEWLLPGGTPLKKVAVSFDKGKTWYEVTNYSQYKELLDNVTKQSDTSKYNKFNIPTGIPQKSADETDERFQQKLKEYQAKVIKGIESFSPRAIKHGLSDVFDNVDDEDILKRKLASLDLEFDDPDPTPQERKTMSP